MPEACAHKHDVAAYAGLDYSAFKKKFVEDNCSRCPLSSDRKNVVFDRGTPEANIMIIGEAPGAREDESGRPFVGRAGKMLDRVLASIGMDTERDTLVVNVVKCRPPKNRPPTSAEAESCRPFLDKQIELVSPKVILLFGATAARHFFPKFGGFSEKAGTIEKNNGRSFMFLYHPAYLLYDPRKKEAMWTHIRALRKFLVEGRWLSEDAPGGEGYAAKPPF